MQINLASEVPIYMQIARQIEDAIFMGAFEEEQQIPSTTEISMQLKINPATVLKGISRLVEEGMVYKKRGLGMFVRPGARKAVGEKRRKEFYDRYIRPLVSEAKKLDLSPQALRELIERGYEE